MKTSNNWNHLFISYALGALILSMYFYKDIKSIEITNTLSISMIINLFIGLFGYLLRFYSISHLETKIYASLSYFGILMAYLYGIFINKDIINLKKIIGTIMILIPNFYLIKN
jgi:drug/metabolite transporter (DMT)-like permease